MRDLALARKQEGMLQQGHLYRAVRATVPSRDPALLPCDEHALSNLVKSYQCSMVRTAMSYVGNRAVAEEVVQDTWLGVWEALASFERRSSLKTWVFGILVSRAKSQRTRESRTIPFSSFESADEKEAPSTAMQLLGANLPDRWNRTLNPEQMLLAREALATVSDAIDALSASQRKVIVMRDVEGGSSAEVCAALRLTKANQRVLLHRARSKVRGALKQRFAHRPHEDDDDAFLLPTS